MAKSIRSKAKRTFRSKKRETGVYAATEAARLHRLNAKLVSVASADKQEGVSAEGFEGDDNDMLESIVVDVETSKRISTHGTRGSRREEWRASKGLVARPARDAMNRQGGIAGRRKAGRSKRRR
ncbi:hypothetical protein BDZ94DRAFT_1279464 [Collybia nuda]|uniref:DUF2423 domain-containing protein n=1 Tax=Collybia nuda TaxID=64659 RepID=A0A9P5YHX7_9AGAR|nr:hypothetical protein BDZ94DRAFT_1279464 [Collybia nuda]